MSIKRQITTTTVIALALGTAAVVAPTATAADDYGLGGKDGSGVIARGNQMASDLGVGSCRVDSREHSGSQAGVSWDTMEPTLSEIPIDPHHTLWGYTISFDNSHDRTFSDWVFRSHASDQINIKDNIRLDGLPTIIPVVEAGQEFGVDENLFVTHTADELATIYIEWEETPSHSLFHQSSLMLKSHNSLRLPLITPYAMHGKITTNKKT